MAAKRYFPFTSGAECRAFIKGMEFSNKNLGAFDSPLEIDGTYWVPGTGEGRRGAVDGMYVVLVTDYTRTRSDRQPKGWKKANRVTIEK